MAESRLIDELLSIVVIFDSILIAVKDVEWVREGECGCESWAYFLGGRCAGHHWNANRASSLDH